MFEAIEDNNKWWLTARMSDCGLIFEEIDKRPIITVAVNAFLFDQFNATAELAVRLGLEEKSVKWSGRAKELEKTIIANFYDRENNTYNISNFNREGSTRIEAENPDDFSLLIPLWAGVDIGEENAIDMVKKFVLPGEATSVEQTVIKLDILKRYGFEAEYAEEKKKFIESFKKPADFNNSVVCAVYLKLITE